MLLPIYNRVTKTTSISNYRKIMYRCKICNSEILESSIKEHLRTTRHHEVVDPFPEARYVDYTDEQWDHFKEIEGVKFKLLGYRDVTTDDPNPYTNLNNIYNCLRCEDLVVGNLATLHSHTQMARCSRGPDFKNFKHMKIIKYKGIKLTRQMSFH